VLAGDSAGAIALGCLSLAWDRKLNVLTKATDGLCLLPRVTVTPHVRKNEGDEQTVDVAAYLTANPPTIGINLSENTMLIIRGATAEAVGTGSVTIFDPAMDQSKPYVRLFGGQQRVLNRGATPDQP
jgi:cyanophycinase-like exopeptidase